MILDKIYVSNTEPSATNILWAKPLEGGAFSLYAFLSGKWGLLKLMNDNGTPYPSDDTPGGSADGGYTKEEIDSKLADILGLDAEGVAELKALIADDDALTGLLSEIARKANTVLLSDYVGSDNPLPTDCIYKRIVRGSEREFKYLLPKEVRYSGDSYLIFRMPDGTDESFVYIVFKREHRTTTMQYYYNASYNTSTDEVPAWVEDAFGYTRSETDNLLNNKVDKEQGKGLSTNDYTTAEKTKLSDLPTASELTTALAGKQNTINDLATIRSGASAGSTAVQPSDLTPIDNRLDNVEYCLGDYLKDIYVFNWENHTTTTTEPIYTTTKISTERYGITCDCKLSAGSTTISALWLGLLDSTDRRMYFTQAGTVTMYLVFIANTSSYQRMISIYDGSGNLIKNIFPGQIPYNSQHICTPVTFEVEAGYYLQMAATGVSVNTLIWLGQIDFEIAGITEVKQIDKDVHANSAAIKAIEQKIPVQASSSNKLVDKNSLASVATTGSYTDLDDKPDLSGFITKSVDDLTYYYTKLEIDTMIGNIETLLATI